MAIDSQKLVADLKPEMKSIAKKVYGWSKEAMVEAAAETKTPLDDFAIKALIDTYEAKLLAKIEAI